jgi:hypothetical protein
VIHSFDRDETEGDMVPQVLLLAILAAAPAPEPGIVARAEKTELRRSDGTAVSRVTRDAAGNVTELLLNDMRLTPDERAGLGALPELRRVVLYRTNAGDDDLKHLVKCTRLESLNLTSTDVTDDAVTALLGFKNLKYLCLGDVKVSPDAVKVLKDRFRERGQGVQFGYSRRKP